MAWAVVSSTAGSFDRPRGTFRSPACAAANRAFERTRRGGPSLASVGGGAPLNLDSLGLSSLTLMRSTTSSRSAMHPLPRNPNEWLTEIADAYADAFGALPFMPFVNVAQDESVLAFIEENLVTFGRIITEKTHNA